MMSFKIFISLAIMLASLSAEAHDAKGLLPPAPSGSEFWAVTCSDDGNGTPTTLLVSLLNETAGGPMVSLQVVTKESPPRYFNIADPIGGDRSPSSEISTSYGGSHYILVNKNAAGIATYQFTYHCYAGAEHTGTAIVRIPQ